MRRFLLALVLFGAVIWILRRFAGLLVAGGTGRSARGARGRSAGREGVTELVRDKVCNTFLPRSKALETTAEGETHYFCSTECRSRFLTGRQADIAHRA